MNKRVLSKVKFLGISLLGLALAQCSLGEQMQETPSAVPLQFRLLRIEAATLGSLDVRGLRKPEDLNLTSRSQLIREYVGGALPLRMQLALEAQNPDQQSATLTGFDYEVTIDGKPLGSGRAVTNLPLPATSTPVALPFTFELNTRPLLGNDALPVLRNFAVGLADRRRRPLRLGLRLRPSLLLADGHTVRATAFAVLATDSVAGAVRIN